MNDSTKSAGDEADPGASSIGDPQAMAMANVVVAVREWRQREEQRREKARAPMRAEWAAEARGKRAIERRKDGASRWTWWERYASMKEAPPVPEPLEASDPGWLRAEIAWRLAALRWTWTRPEGLPHYLRHRDPDQIVQQWARWEKAGSPATARPAGAAIGGTGEGQKRGKAFLDMLARLEAPGGPWHRPDERGSV
jgi:hypothetical protein